MNLSTRLLTVASNGVAIDTTVKEMLAGDTAGAVMAKPGVASGLYPIRLPLLAGRNADGSALVASSPGAGNFVLAASLATSLVLTGHAAQNNTKADAALWELTLPPGYVAGSDITATLNAKYAAASGTAGTCTVIAAAYKLADAGTMGANLVATSAAAITATAADKAFTIAGATLSPGDRILVEAIASVQETGNTGTIIATLNSARLS